MPSSCGVKKCWRQEVLEEWKYPARSHGDTVMALWHGVVGPYTWVVLGQGFCPYPCHRPVCKAWCIPKIGRTNKCLQLQVVIRAEGSPHFGYETSILAIIIQKLKCCRLCRSRCDRSAPRQQTNALTNGRADERAQRPANKSSVSSAQHCAIGTADSRISIIKPPVDLSTSKTKMLAHWRSRQPAAAV